MILSLLMVTTILMIVEKSKGELNLMEEIEPETDIMPEMETFSHSIKKMECEENKEITLFESEMNRGGIITYQWIDNYDWWNEHSIIRIYVDYELKPSIQYSLMLGHGIPYDLCDVNDINNTIGKFGTHYISHESKYGGLSNFYMIPFNKHIKINIIVFKKGNLSFTIRGMYNITSMIFSEETFNYKLPQNTRLYLYRTEHKLLHKEQHISLSQINNSSGFLFQVTLMTEAIESNNWLYLEACFRANIDGTFYNLSSGTEDFFGSSMYYDEGTYAANQYGATWIDNIKYATTTYRFFTEDPILFHHTFELIWKDGENNYCNEKLKIINFSGNISNVNVTAYVWVYQFNNNDNENNNNVAPPQFQGTYQIPQHIPRHCNNYTINNLTEINQQNQNRNDGERINNHQSLHFKSKYIKHTPFMIVLAILPILAFFALQLSG